MKINYILLAIFTVLQIADVVTTIKVLQLPNRKEANKLMSWLMERIGITQALIISKVIAVSIFVIAAYLYPGFPNTSGCLPHILSIVLIGWSGFYVWVIRNNCSLM
jgi:hypothetical protein